MCPIGDSGTDKSHLLIGLGAYAVQQWHEVKDAPAAKLVNELVEAADEKWLSKTIARYGRVDLLCHDELGAWNWIVAAPKCCSRFPRVGGDQCGGHRLQRELQRLDRDLHLPLPVAQRLQVPIPLFCAAAAAGGGRELGGNSELAAARRLARRRRRRLSARREPMTPLQSRVIAAHR
jgi:hypothetical protein